MKYIFIPVLILVFYFNLPAQPASDAVFEKVIKEYTLNDDGSIDFHYYKRLKLLTHHSFNRLYGETFIVYNPQHQALRINKAMVTQKDGKIVTSPQNAFNEVLPQFASDAPAYNHLREMVVTHAGVELDAIIELDYTLHTNKDYFPALMADEILTSGSPVNEEIIMIKIPKGINLNYKVFNIRTSPEISESANTKEYHFSFKGINENSHESYQPLFNDHLPRLIFSTIDWTNAAEFLTQQECFNYKTDESMNSWVKKVKKECTSDLSFILKMHEMVALEINTYPVPGEFSGFAGRNPIEVWKSNGGTPFEKCILLTSLLRAAGINAEPLVVVPTPVFDDKIGNLALVSDYLVQVNPRELEQMILSPTEYGIQNLIYTMNGKTTLVLNPEKPFKTSIHEKFENKVIMSADLVLNDSVKLSGKADLALFEKTNPYYRLKNDSTYIKQLIGGLPARDIASCKILNVAQMRSNLSLEIKANNPLKKEANYYFLGLPFCKNGSDGWHISYLNAERKAGLEIPFPVNEQYSFTITLPPDMNLVNPLELTEIKTGFGELVLNIVQKDNKITIKKMLVISTQTIPVTEYKAFKQMMDLWNDKKCRELILKKTI